MIRTSERFFSGIPVTNTGKIGDGEVPALLQSVFHRGATGVLRLRNGRRSSAVWFVKGQVVHSMSTQSGRKSEGIASLRHLSTSGGGTFFWDRNKLPPARTIRISMQKVMEQVLEWVQIKTIATPMTRENSLANLHDVLQELRTRVPGIESLSLLDGLEVIDSTWQDPAEQRRVASQIPIVADRNLPADRLFVQYGDVQLLAIRAQDQLMVLEANSDTSAEAILWAGARALGHLRNGTAACEGVR